MHNSQNQAFLGSLLKMSKFKPFYSSSSEEENEWIVLQWSGLPEKEYPKQIHDEMDTAFIFWFDLTYKYVCKSHNETVSAAKKLKTNILKGILIDHGMIYTKGKETLDWTIWAVVFKFPSHT